MPASLRRLLPLTVAVAAALGGCSFGGGSEPSAAAPDPPATTPAVVAVDTTVTTATTATATTAAADVLAEGDGYVSRGNLALCDCPSSTTTSSTTTTTTTTTAPPPPLPVDFWPLTGQPADSDADLTRRPVAAKIDNSRGAAGGQYGLNEADVVYEVLIEGGSTRFLAVFHSNIPAKIGPVRSVRSSDFGLLADLPRPYLASSGANPTVLEELRAADGAGIVHDAGALAGTPAYGVDSHRRGPHNRFFYYREFVLNAGLSSSGGTPHLFDRILGHASPSDLTEAGGGVTVAYGAHTVSHIWEPNLDGWVRVSNGEVHTSRSAGRVAEIAPATVLVALSPYRTSAADPRSPQADLVGSGECLLLTRGTVTECDWERTRHAAGWRLTALDGTTLDVSEGAVWVLLANTAGPHPVSRVSIIPAEDAAETLAAARRGRGG